MAGALSFSLILPGAGLFLTDNNGFAISYLSVSSLSYLIGVVFLNAGEDGANNRTLAFPFFLAGGVTHLIGFVHTLITTIKYNESFQPYVTFNGKFYQVGFSLNF